MKPIKTLDLFCGAGGSSYGAQCAGAEIIAGFDFWKPAIDTYSLNFKKAKTYLHDIRDLNVEKVAKEIGKIDLILGSPECTNHSVAKGAKVRCEISKKTAFEVVRFAEVFMPRWIIIENVVQMKSWSRHAELVKQLNELNYSVTNLSLNSKNFGVPQSRERLFMICSRYGVDFDLPDFKQKEIGAYSLIDTSNQYKFSPLFATGRAQNTIERAERAIAALGTKEPFLLVYYGSDGAGGWQPLDKPLRTITTLDRFAYVKPGPVGHEMRMLQPEELKRGMGYDSRFNFAPSLSRRDKVKLMGNGVCPPVMEAIINCF